MVLSSRALCKIAVPPEAFIYTWADQNLNSVKNYYDFTLFLQLLCLTFTIHCTIIINCWGMCCEANSVQFSFHSHTKPAVESMTSSNNTVLYLPCIEAHTGLWSAPFHRDLVSLISKFPTHPLFVSPVTHACLCRLQ